MAVGLLIVPEPGELRGFVRVAVARRPVLLVQGWAGPRAAPKAELLQRACRGIALILRQLAEPS